MWHTMKFYLEVKKMKFATCMNIDGSRNHYESVTSQLYKKIGGAYSQSNIESRIKCVLIHFLKVSLAFKETELFLNLATKLIKCFRII